MKIEYSVKQLKRCASQTHSINLIDYYGTTKVLEDLERVLEFHTLKYEKFKREYIEKWGQERWDDMVKGEE